MLNPAIGRCYCLLNFNLQFALSRIVTLRIMELAGHVVRVGYEDIAGKARRKKATGKTKTRLDNMIYASLGTKKY